MTKTSTHTPAVQGKSLFRSYSPAEYELVLERAKARARQARHDALNDFWHWPDGSVDALLGSASRAALRLSRTLQRHQSLRKQQGA